MCCRRVEPEPTSEVPDVHIVNTVTVEGIKDPPEAVMNVLNPDQKASFQRRWDRVPQHVQEISFNFEEELWTPGDIDDPGDLL